MSHLMSHMMPHLTREVRMRLQWDSAALVAELPWSEPGPAAQALDSVAIAVQVLGKLRGTVTTPPDAPADKAIAVADAQAKLARLLEGERIHVPNRIVNFVVVG